MSSATITRSKSFDATKSRKPISNQSLKGNRMSNTIFKSKPVDNQSLGEYDSFEEVNNSNMGEERTIIPSRPANQKNDET